MSPFLDMPSFGPYSWAAAVPANASSGVAAAATTPSANVDLQLTSSMAPPRLRRARVRTTGFSAHVIDLSNHYSAKSIEHSLECLKGPSKKCAILSGTTETRVVRRNPLAPKVEPVTALRVTIWREARGSGCGPFRPRPQECLAATAKTSIAGGGGRRNGCADGAGVKSPHGYEPDRSRCRSSPLDAKMSEGGCLTAPERRIRGLPMSCHCRR